MNDNQKESNFVNVRVKERFIQRLRPKSNDLTSLPKWQMKGDLRKQIKFPKHISKALLTAESFFLILGKEFLLYKLTIPWEENIVQVDKRKLDKYQELKEIWQNNSQEMHYPTVEKEHWVFAASSLSKAMSDIGINGESKRKAIKNYQKLPSKPQHGYASNLRAHGRLQIPQSLLFAKKYL